MHPGKIFDPVLVINPFKDDPFDAIDTVYLTGLNQPSGFCELTLREGSNDLKEGKGPVPDYGTVEIFLNLPDGKYEQPTLDICYAPRFPKYDSRTVGEKAMATLEKLLSGDRYTCQRTDHGRGGMTLHLSNIIVRNYDEWKKFAADPQEYAEGLLSKLTDSSRGEKWIFDNDGQTNEVLFEGAPLGKSSFRAFQNPRSDPAPEFLVAETIVHEMYGSLAQQLHGVFSSRDKAMEKAKRLLEERKVGGSRPHDYLIELANYNIIPTIGPVMR